MAGLGYIEVIRMQTQESCQDDQNCAGSKYSQNLNLSTECEAGHQCTGEGKQLEARIFAMLDALAFKVSLEIGNFLDAQKMIGIHSTYPIVVIQSDLSLCIKGMFFKNMFFL